MVAAGGRKRRPRGSIDAAMILEGAFDVARSEGLSGMSMPSIASKLDVGVTSLYWYFRSKEDLLQQMRNLALRELVTALPSREGQDPKHWRTYVFELFTATRDFYSNNDLIAELILFRQVETDLIETQIVYEPLESDLRFLIQAGFDPQEAWNLYASLSMFTHNVAATERKSRSVAFPKTVEEQLKILNREDTPILAELIEKHEVSLDFTGSTFEPGLNLMLDAAELRLSKKH